MSARPPPASNPIPSPNATITSRLGPTGDTGKDAVSITSSTSTALSWMITELEDGSHLRTARRRDSAKATGTAVVVEVHIQLVVFGCFHHGGIITKFADSGAAGYSAFSAPVRMNLS